MFSVQTNISSMLNLKSIYSATNLVRTSSERLSSGLRINHAADDPSGLAISKGMQAHYRGISTALQNMQDFEAYLEARDRSMNQQMACALRIRDLAVRAANNATLTSSDMQKMDDEAKQLSAEVDQIGKTATLRDTTTPGSGIATLFGPGEIDVVWVLDDTTSMTDHLANLAATGAAQMFNDLTAKKFDVRMAAFGFGTGPDVVHDTNGDTPPNNISLATYPNTLVAPGKVFENTAAGFAADVNAINAARFTTTGLERGIAATYQSASALGIAPSAAASNVQFRQDAQKIFIIITDEDSDDAGMDEPTGGTYTVGNYIKTQLTDLLTTKYGTANAPQIWTAASQQNVTGFPTPPGGTGSPAGSPTDQDYLDLVAATEGTSAQLDWETGATTGTTWINKVDSNLQGLGGPYNLDFQYGPDSTDNLQVTFKTVTATTAGLNVNLKTAASAQTAIDTVNSGIKFISDEQAFTGQWENRINKMINDYTTQMINTQGACSKIEDADMADQASQMAKQQIIVNAATSIAAQAGNLPRNVVDLLNKEGIGQNGVFSSGQ